RTCAPHRWPPLGRRTQGPSRARSRRGPLGACGTSRTQALSVSLLLARTTPGWYYGGQERCRAPAQASGLGLSAPSRVAEGHLPPAVRPAPRRDPALHLAVEQRPHLLHGGLVL